MECDITQPAGLTEAGKADAKIIKQKKSRLKWQQKKQQALSSLSIAIGRLQNDDEFLCIEDGISSP
ncbi:MULTISPECIES: hypothetical protein [Gammaproteobacteria]|uniref:Uncharacterized protein n=2 Tax=Pseudomonas TaxID=286 RepID=A0A423IEJ1_9PSED|nr:MULTISPECIES: hypothetical protein [Gammaproteobacteria]MBK5304112.1 hypothetical protein [Bacillus sp. TH86]MBK5323881.1 hypothetical protein [Bacillus sp. TH59]MBK5338831.1 hypothetical protein [Bacillus sp. TH57]MBK5312882.1 hypothetical protein [Pseudomonas sp. TH71]MBK5318379.1 hypothetical protein [Erwinia sp. TH79]